MDKVKGRRALRKDFGVGPDAAPTSGYVDVLGAEYPIPDWLITEEYQDEVVGEIKSGKEGSVSLVLRSSDHRSCLLASKSYVDRKKRSFQNDTVYREGRRFTRDSREQRAIAAGTGFGKELLTGNWFDTEYWALREMWEAGASVPYPVSFDGSRLLMQYLGDWDRAAPRLIDARIDKALAKELLDQVLHQIRLFTAHERVHGDLSAYNILVWHDQAWIIDLPQSVNLFHNQFGVELLTRDINNVATYFAKFGAECDPGAELAACLAGAFG